ncbi:MAG: JAB domain-containing protein [Bacteroidia bacterium]
MNNITINEVELHYRQPQCKESVFIRSSKDAYNVLRNVFDNNQIGIREEFVALYLDRSNKVIGSYTGFKGGITGVVVDPRIVFSIALKCLAVSIVIAHNHPSGNLTPSHEDREVTTKIKEGGRFLDIHLLDHLILNPEGEYFSFSDDGLI